MLVNLKSLLNKQVINNAIVYKFAILFIFGFFTSIFFNPLSGNIVQDSVFYLNAIGASLCLVLILREAHVWHSPEHLTYFMYCVLVFCLPFLSSYTLVRSEFFYTWIVNLGLASILLKIFIRDTKVFYVLFISGCIFGYALATILNISNAPDPSPPYIVFDYQYAAYSCAFYLLLISLRIHNRLFVEKQVYLLIEKKVIERTESLKQAMNIQQEFLDNVSHEIKTPIHNITNIAKELYDQWDRMSDDSKKALVKTLNFCNNGLIELCNNLLDLSKLNQENPPHIKKYNILDLIKKILKEFSKHEEHIMLDMQLDIFLYCDESMILQVLRNIIDNAITYCPSAPIHIKARNKNANTIISISDQGVGILNSELKSIFSPFVQGSRTKTGAGGTGLGLSICKKIVGMHGGKIWAEPNKTKGTTFIFTIPNAKKND